MNTYGDILLQRLPSEGLKLLFDLDHVYLTPRHNHAH